MARARKAGGPDRRRRRGARGERLRKVGWQVSGVVAEAVKQAVEDGAAESQNAFVEDALRRRLKELRRDRVYAAYAEAARDPAFLKDMGAVSRAFDATVRDGMDGGS